MAESWFGNYRATELLGEGATGRVFLAINPDLGKRAAVKVLRESLAGDAALSARFLTEARATAAIRHPGIVDVLDCGRASDGTPYILMEWLDGQSLERRIAAGPLPLSEALEISRQAALALSAAHALGVVHRDVKPSNLFLVADPEGPAGSRVKVLDFGIAKVNAELFAGAVRTQTGRLMGTPTYMAPEQCLATKEIDRRADIYSLGVVLFEMVCGQPPFVSSAIGELINLHVNGRPPIPSSLRADLPAEIDRLIAISLAKNPADRFQTMDDFAREAGAMARSGRRADRATMPGDPDLLGPPQSAYGDPRRTSSRRTVPPVVLPSSNRDQRHAGRLALLGGMALALVLGTAALGARRHFASLGRSRSGAIPFLVEPRSATAAPPTPISPRPAVAGEATVTQVRVKLETVPAGARVVDLLQGSDLGITPLSIERPRGDGVLLTFGLSGYAKAERVVRFELDHDERIVLDAALAPLPPSPEPNKSEKKSNRSAELAPMKL